MAMTTDASREASTSLDDSPSGLFRLIGRLGGMFAGRRSAPGAVAPDRGAAVLDESSKRLSTHFVIEPLNPVGPNRRGIQRSLESSRELMDPIVDVFEEPDHLLIAVILPGVDPVLAQLELIDDLLIISSRTPAPEHRKEVPLPAVFDRRCMSRTERDGVLEVRFDLRRASRILPGSWSGD